MNASTQEMFESVRAAVSGRVQEDHELRDLAERVAEASTAVRRRIERAVGYARSGLRLEAFAEADSEPSVFEMAAQFDTDELKHWRSMCTKGRMPAPEVLSPEAILEIEEAIALLAPLRSRLAQMRRLVLADAPAWDRLQVLRELIDRDPDNPAWESDRRALEPVAADQLGERFEASMRAGDLEDASACVERMEDGRWHWGGVAKVVAPLRTRLDAEFASRATARLRGLTERVEAEWSAENEVGALAQLEQWRSCEQQLMGYGGEAPQELVDRIAQVESWLGERERQARAMREHRDRAAELERVAVDEATTLAQLRAAMRAAEETSEGVPDDVRAVAERRMETLERRIRTRRMAMIGAVVLLLAVGSVGAFIYIRRADELNRIESAASAAQKLVDAGELDRAQKTLDDAEADPKMANQPRLIEVRAKLAAARAPIEAAQRRFNEAFSEAGDPEAATARPDRMEEAKADARTEEQQKKVMEWQRAHERATAARRDDRVRAAIALVKEISAEISAAKPDADPSWAGTFAKWEGALGAVERADGSLPEVKQELDLAATLLATQRGRSAAAHLGVARAAAIEALGTAATSPASLAAALEDFARTHPDAPAAKDFVRAAAARPSWDAVVAFGALAPKQGAALAGAPHKDRVAAIAMLDAYTRANPASPYAPQVAALRALLDTPSAATPAWRTWLLDKTGTLEDFNLYTLERTDGTRFYSRQDPRKVPWQAQSGDQWKSVMCIGGRSGKESFERFDRSTLRGEGPSPQTELAKSLREQLGDATGTVNGVELAFQVLTALRDNETVDGAFLAIICKGLLETMTPEVPAALRPQFEEGVSRLARVNADDIDWKNAGDANARTRSRAARAAVREALQPDAWRRAYQQQMAAATAAFTTPCVPAGVLVIADGAPRVIPAAGQALAPQTALYIVDAGAGDRGASLVRIGAVGADGSVAFESAARGLPAGTMVFAPRKGTP